MNWLTNYSIWTQGLIVSSIIFGIILFIGSFLHFVKPNLKRKSIKFIYAFGSGFMLITAIMGQFVEARERLIDHFETDGGMSPFNVFIIFLLVLLGTIIGGTIAIVMMKAFSKYKLKSLDKNHSHEIDNIYDALTHGHSKIPGIMLILSHRLPAGFAIGGLLYNASKNNSAFATMALVSFILHIIPELLIIYYGLIDSGQNKRKAFLHSLLAKIIIIPGVFIGISIGEITSSEFMYWLQPLIFIVTGVLITWGIVLELVPEFVHNKNDGQVLSSMAFVFIIGLSLSLFIQFIHLH